MTASFLNASNHWSHIQAFIASRNTQRQVVVPLASEETHGMVKSYGTRSTPPADATKGLLTPEQLKPLKSRDKRGTFIVQTPRPVVGYNTAPRAETFLDWLCGTTKDNGPADCICEQDDNCLLLYRHREYGFELSPDVLAWLPDAVAKTEAKCKAEQHYTSVADAEWLAQDVTLDVDDPAETMASFWNDVDDDHVLYLDRTNTTGRWIESAIVVADDADEASIQGLRVDRDTNDYTTMIRSHEMTKRRELFLAIRANGLPMAEAATWVKARIAIKRADAIRAKREAEAATCWTEGFPLPSESQIRLRAYASCLTAIQRSGADTKLKTWEPVKTTRLRDNSRRTQLAPRSTADRLRATA